MRDDRNTEETNPTSTSEIIVEIRQKSTTIKTACATILGIGVNRGGHDEHTITCIQQDARKECQLRVWARDCVQNSTSRSKTIDSFVFSSCDPKS